MLSLAMNLFPGDLVSLPIIKYFSSSVKTKCKISVFTRGKGEGGLTPLMSRLFNVYVKQFNLINSVS